MKKLKFRRPTVLNRTRRRCYKSFKLTPFSTFHLGEVYLFHRTDHYCPPKSSLWALLDKQNETGIYLESSSYDLRKFELWHKLPDDYEYCRLATRAELRDFSFALAWFECNTKR